MRVLIIRADCYSEKYFINEDLKLPKGVLDELKEIAIPLAEKLHCSFEVGFYENGEVYMKTEAGEGDINYDDIGAVLEIKRLEMEKRKLIDQLTIFYKLCCMERE